jgi:cytochrome P450
MQQLFASLTLDVSTEVFFGASTHLLSSKQAERTEGQEFAEAFDYAQRTLVGTEDYNVFKLLGKLFFGDRKLRLSLHVIEKFVDKILDRALLERDVRAEQEVPAEEKSLPDALLGVGRSRKDIKDDIINLVLAGKDATAAVLSSTWYMLSQHPDVYEKLRDEISVLEGRPPAKEDLPRFSYLQMVLQEGMFEAVQRTRPDVRCLPFSGVC